MNKEQMQVVILIAIVTIAIYAGTIMILINPSIAKRESLKTQQESLLKELKEKKGIAAKENKIFEEINELKLKIQSYKTQFLSKSESEFFRETLRDMAGEYNVKILRDQASNVDDDKKSVFKNNLSFTEKQINLTLTGTYHDFGNFVNRIESISIFRKIESFTLKPEANVKKLNIEMSILSLINENPT